MKYYALLYQVVDDYIARRAPFRTEHLGRAREAYARGELLLAGAYNDPPNGALFVFRAPDKSVVEEFVLRDPYVLNNLVRRWEIREWTVVVGEDVGGG